MLARAQAIQDQLVKWRRAIHQYPEVGFTETRTAALVAEELRRLGLRVETGVGKTGVVGYLGGGSPVVGLRADMDALPLQETNAVPYASCAPGAMHACGHDAHTAMLLGAATLLAQLNRESPLPGQVRFIFQPSEETVDDEGKSGAMRMADAGVMDGVDIVLAQHVTADHVTGDIVAGADLISAAEDTFRIKLIGRGGHAAYPHHTVDPIFMLGQVLNAIHGVVARKNNPVKPAVISVCSVHGGAAANVIPDSVELMGTCRSADEGTRQFLLAELEKTLGVVRALGGDYEFQVMPGQPSAHDTPAGAELIRQVGIDLLGADHIKPPKSGLGAEDFGVFVARAREGGTMFGLGVWSGEGEKRVAHSPTFDIDERALPVGTAVMAEATLRYLRGQVPLQK
jgi:amidohydrolase